MYINVWLGEVGWRVPGDSYPSGGAVSKTLDIFRWLTPHVDFIAPDIYTADSRGYESICAAYARDDNPLFIPESAPGGSNPWLMFRALADYNAIGYHFFAVEEIVGDDGAVRPEAQMLVDSFRCTASALPLLLKHQGTGKIHAVVQEENLASQTFDLEGYYGLVLFDSPSVPRPHKDWRHGPKRPTASDQRAEERGRGLVFQVSEHEFYLVGGGYRLLLRPKTAPEKALDASLAKDSLLACLANYVCVDEGHFDPQGSFVVDRRRNGDETAAGVWVEPDVGVVRVLLCG
jgi:hypothetical protein